MLKYTLYNQYFCMRLKFMNFKKSYRLFNKRQRAAALAAISFAGCFFTSSASYAKTIEPKNTSSDLKKLGNSVNKNAVIYTVHTTLGVRNMPLTTLLLLLIK